MNDERAHDEGRDDDAGAPAPAAPLAVRHRPRRFADVVGQRAVRAALAAAVRSGEPPRQLLLSGGSGLGKTTIARIFAGALLCEDPQGDGDCCGHCGSCVAVWDQAEPHPDVIEMDAASNGGKDEIAALSARVNLAPLRGHWKVFIVDEAHGITRAGADAFLKLLEEPPAHVIFVLATTEAHKMLPTIRGRCVELGFSAPSPDELRSHVTAVAAAEGWPISEAVAEAVVDSVGEGLGVRGALSALGRIAGLAAAGVELDDTAAAELLGAAPRSAVVALRDAITEGRLADTYSEAAKLCERYPVSEVRRVLVRQLRDDLRRAAAPEVDVAARRLSAVAAVGEGAHWFEIGIARAATAELDTGAGLAELCERAEAAAGRLAQLLADTPTPEPAGAAGPAAPAAAAAAPAERDGHDDTHEPRPEGTTTPEPQPGPGNGPQSEAPASPSVDERRRRPATPAAPEVHHDDAPPHTDDDAAAHGSDDEPDAAPWESDPWFDDPRSSTTNPNGEGGRAPRAPARKAPARKAPAKKAAKRSAKKAPAKKAAAKAPAKAPARPNGATAPNGAERHDTTAPRRRTGAPAAGNGIDLARLTAVVAARDDLAARILGQCAVSAGDGTLTIVVPAKLAEGLRARPELRTVIEAAATALGAASVTWKAKRPR